MSTVGENEDWRSDAHVGGTAVVSDAGSEVGGPATMSYVGSEFFEEQTVGTNDYNPEDLISSWMIGRGGPPVTEIAMSRNQDSERLTMDPDGLPIDPLVPSSQFRKASSFYLSQRQLILLAIVAFLLGVSAIVVVVIASAKAKEPSANGGIQDPPVIVPTASPPSFVFPTNAPETSSTTMSPSMSPATAAPTSVAAAELFRFLQKVSFDSGLALSNKKSPQYKAFQWMSSDESEYNETQLVQRYVLATLYYSTGGDQWENGQGWLNTATSECEWQFGGPESLLHNTTNQTLTEELDKDDATSLNDIDSPSKSSSVCNSDGQVVRIAMLSKNLEGTIPPELGLLSSTLTSLSFENNRLNGALPSELFYLTALTDLNLRKNSIDGPILDQVGRLTNLTTLALEDNLFTGSIASANFSSSLEVLLLGNNSLTGSLPTSLASLQDLDILSLYANEFTGSLPSEVGAMNELEQLLVYKNKLSGIIPTEIGLMTELKVLALNNNELTGNIPSEMGLLELVEILDLSTNKLNGTIPSELAEMKSLEVLNVSKNTLTGHVSKDLCELSPGALEVDCREIVCSCCKDTCLQSFLTQDLEENFTQEFANFSSPQHLAFKWVAQDAFLDTYQRPQVIQRYVLAVLYYSTNGDEWLDQKGYLQEGENECSWGVSLSERITPESAFASSSRGGRMPENAIDFKSNTRWSSAIQDNEWIALDLGRPHALSVVDIIWKTPATVYRIDLSDDKMNWTTIETVENDRSALQRRENTMDLGGAHGRYVRMFGLERLNNETAGMSIYQFNVFGIPTDFVVCDEDLNIATIDLHENGLVGTIPIELSLLSGSLQTLNLATNKIHGTIPSAVGELNLVQTIHVGDNNLEGSIPTEIGNLKSLKFLRLNNNTLSGDPPLELGLLTNLEILDIAGNNITGKIHPSVCELSVQDILVDCAEIECSCCNSC